MGDQAATQSLSQSLKSAQDHLARPPGSAADTMAAMAQARDVDELERIRRAVEAAGEAAYHWTLASDRILWNTDAASLLRVSEPDNLKSGRSFADLLDSENTASRFDAVMRSRETDNGSGVPYCIEYRMRPQGRQSSASIWVEDSGRWYAGNDGKPAEAFGVIRPIDDRHERDERLEFLSNCDPLTGMMNRGRMADKLAGAIARSKESGVGCGFLIAIINNLAVVNDAYGFDIADEVIVSVGKRLSNVVRQDDYIARYSGAKYAILLTECTQDELKLAAERFLRVARDRVIETEMGPVWAMLSIGGVFLPKHADGANAAMANAEEALAEAKRQTSDCFVAFQPSAERVSVRDLNARCAAEIVSGLREDRFALAFQPVVKADTGEAVMHEALLRMKCTEDGDVVAASHLIPIAEKLGLVRLIDQTVIKLAIQTLNAYEEAHVSVNVSGTTAADPRWYIQLAEELQQFPEAASRLVIEITETAVLKDLEEAAVFVNRLRELGCKVAIDDFGAGYTSFRNLKILNVDMVKIDGTFCENLSDNQDNQYFVRSLIDLAKKFDLEVIAEWVENSVDAKLLRELGVDYLQGHLYGEALIMEPWGAAANASGSEHHVVPPADVLAQAQSQPDTPSLIPAVHDDDAADNQPAFSVDVQANPDVLDNLFCSDASPEEPFVPVPGTDDVHSTLASGEATDEPFLPLAEDADKRSAGDETVLPAQADADDSNEPFGSGLDLSRLKSAVSALDANFAARMIEDQDPQSDQVDGPRTDMASAIQAAFGNAS